MKDSKKSKYYQLKTKVYETEKEYEKALELFEGLITGINRNLINGTPDNNKPLKLLIKPYTERLTKANFNFLLANKAFHSFIDITTGVIKQ